MGRERETESKTYTEQARSGSVIGWSANPRKQQIRYVLVLLLGRKVREEAEGNDCRPLASHRLGKGSPGRRGRLFEKRAVQQSVSSPLLWQHDFVRSSIDIDPLLESGRVCAGRGSDPLWLLRTDHGRRGSSHLVLLGCHEEARAAFKYLQPSRLSWWCSWHHRAETSHPAGAFQNSWPMKSTSTVKHCWFLSHLGLLGSSQDWNKDFLWGFWFVCTLGGNQKKRPDSYILASQHPCNSKGVYIGLTLLSQHYFQRSHS